MSTGSPVDALTSRQSRSVWSRFWSRVRSSRWLLAGTAAIGLLIMFAVFLGGIAVFDWTESTGFCSSCHVMKPEVTAYHSSPHSRVDCGTCHVGPGVLPAVQAKLANARYLWEVPTNSFPRPIPSPVKGMRPVEVVCEQCHWPQKFYEDRLLTVSTYAEDEANSKTQTMLLLKTGGGSAAAGLGRGIHWHIDNPVYYVATDEQRQDIPWVQATYNGQTTTYISSDSELTSEQVASAPKRKMDCIDCHNRATHIFQNPSDALDEAMANGTIAPDLPFLKREADKVLLKTYATEEEATAAVATVGDFYKTQYPDLYAQREAEVQRAVAGLQNIVDTTQFPFMDVNWDTHPNNIGHSESPGCFRCHDGKHVSSDNQTIRLECNLCHGIPQVSGPGQTIAALPLTTPGKEPASHQSTSWLSEHRTQFDASCATCHNVENPGGSDNSSFCSNSACHGTNWKYVGLNAPQVRETSPASTGSPPAIPHPVTARTNCMLCHAAGKVRPFPASHASYTIEMCQQCHQPTVKEEAAPAATPTEAPTSGGAMVPTVAVTPTATAAATATSAGSGIPLIPHDLAGRDQCLLCHAVGGPAPNVPADHAGRTNDMCQSCHKPAGAAAPAGPTVTATATAAATAAATATMTVTATTVPATTGVPTIPHDLAGRDQCLLCHAVGGPAPNVPADHAGRTNDMCESCHKPAGAAAPAGAAPAASAPPLVPHSLEARSQCLLCHAAGGAATNVPADHAGRTNDTCLGCHKPSQS